MLRRMSSFITRRSRPTGTAACKTTSASSTPRSAAKGDRRPSTSGLSEGRQCPRPGGAGLRAVAREVAGTTGHLAGGLGSLTRGRRQIPTPARPSEDGAAWSYLEGGDAPAVEHDE